MPLTYRETTLSNGLRIAAEIDPAAHTAAIGFFVKTGARDEAPEAMGVSHFLEHMMFKGTGTRKAADVDRDFDDIGAHHNAFTTSEMTAFWAHCLPEHLFRAEEVLADIMRPAIRQEDFDDEKPVILEEIAMYQDQPFWVLFERAMEEYYGAHPLSHRVLGTAETIQALARDRMRAYLDDRYSADNTVVSLAGKVDFDATVERIAAHCGRWRRTGAGRAHPERPAASERFTIRSDRASRHYILMIAPAPGMADERRYAAAMLAQILGDSDGSRLYWALIETGLAEEAQAQYDGRDGLGDYVLYASCSPANGERVEKMMEDEAARVMDSIEPDDLERVRNKIATAATLHGELPAGRMRRLGRQLTYLGEYRSLETELARIAAVTIDDLRAAHDAFPPLPVVVGRLTPA